MLNSSGLVLETSQVMMTPGTNPHNSHWNSVVCALKTDQVDNDIDGADDVCTNCH